jgi:chemotaxis protein methyltransferase CheR
MPPTSIRVFDIKARRTASLHLSSIRGFTVNYQQSGGKQAFADYYTAAYAAAISTSRWQPSSLLTTAQYGQRVFGNQLVLCRNVLIYFNKKRTAPLDCFTNRWTSRFLYLGGKERLIFPAMPPASSHWRAPSDFSQAAGPWTRSFRRNCIKAVVIECFGRRLMR